MSVNDNNKYLIVKPILNKDGCCIAQEVIDSIPSTDVAPVRHGRWEAIEWAVNRSGEIIIGRLYRCSECRRIVDLEHDETLNDYPYCHCGAKMDEVVDDESA